MDDLELAKAISSPSVDHLLGVVNIVGTFLYLSTATHWWNQSILPSLFQDFISNQIRISVSAVSYTHLRAHETLMNLVCRLLLEKKKQN